MYWCLPVFRMIMPFSGRGTCSLEHSTILFHSVCMCLLLHIHIRFVG
jgi:hypothetical protein